MSTTYKEAMRDAHAQATAASAQYNAAKNVTERRAAVKAIRAAEQVCASAYAAWEADPAATW